MAGSKKAKPAAASSTSPPPAAAPAEASASASTAAASSSDAVANSASAPVAVAAPAVARPLQLPASYSADRGETTIRQLREEAQQLRRRVERVGQETPAERMRAKEIETELVQQRALLSLHRTQARGVALLALAVLLFIAVVWILLGWDSPTLWMERMNKQARHDDMMQATGGTTYAKQTL